MADNERKFHSDDFDSNDNTLISEEDLGEVFHDLVDKVRNLSRDKLALLQWMISDAPNKSDYTWKPAEVWDRYVLKNNIHSTELDHRRKLQSFAKGTQAMYTKLLLYSGKSKGTRYVLPTWTRHVLAYVGADDPRKPLLYNLAILALRKLKNTEGSYAHLEYAQKRDPSFFDLEVMVNPAFSVNENLQITGRSTTFDDLFNTSQNDYPCDLFSFFDTHNVREKETGKKFSKVISEILGHNAAIHGVPILVDGGDKATTYRIYMNYQNKHPGLQGILVKK